MMKLKRNCADIDKKIYFTCIYSSSLFNFLFLLIKNQNTLIRKIPIFFYCFFVLVFIELILKYTGTSSFFRLFYIFFPLILSVIIYPLLIFNFKKDLKNE